MTRSARALARGARNGVSKRADAQGLGPRGEVAPVHGVPVPEQVRGLAAPRQRLDELAPDPRRRRVRRHAAVNELPAVVRDEEEHV
jgi:hypothetical protein